MEFEDYLKILSSRDGSDLYLSTGAPPCAKFQGTLKPLEKVVMAPGTIKDIAYKLMDAKQREEFEEELEMNLAHSIPQVGRFRVNIFKQRNEISIVARNIKVDIPKFEDLGLPEILKQVITEKRGLVLFVGATGSGKSTSLAALIDHRNSTSAGHIITIEDPVEFVHRHKKSVINQREVGVDTRSFHSALKNTLRQAPDVILIGEVRERDTMEHCLAFAETGHLAISTLHANNANQALDRIINFFPEDRRQQLLMDLSTSMKAIVSQRLIPTVDGKRVAAVEILLGTATIQKKILNGEMEEIKGIMEKSENLGMQTFDSAIFKLYKAGKITLDDAIRNADSANNLRLKIKLSNRDEPGAAEEDSAESNAFSFSLEKISEDVADDEPVNPFAPKN